MTTINGKPVNTNAVELPVTEASLSLEQIEEIEHRHEDVGPTLHDRLVREDLAATAARERLVAARRGRQDALSVAGAPVVPSEQRKAVLVAYGRCCAYCEKASGLGLTLLVSAASGGKPTLTNTVPACLACRKLQGSHDAIDWLHGEITFDMGAIFARINAATLRLRTRTTVRRAA